MKNHTKLITEIKVAHSVLMDRRRIRVEQQMLQNACALQARSDRKYIKQRNRWQYLAPNVLQEEPVMDIGMKFLHAVVIGWIESLLVIMHSGLKS